ncbi:prepilin peptidase [Anoxybacteroides rupiense]|uniref:prepilin peptidase n=1 Tax=Anoxybacteroides rupiense TaxID=311460 RepID=UPI0039647EBF
MIFYTIYATVNLITDIKYRRTKNYWHLIFFALGIYYAYLERSVQEIVFAIFLSISIGLLLERNKVFSAGDTKMVIVTCIWLSFLVSLPIFQLVCFVFLFYLLPLLAMGFFFMIKRNGVKKTVKKKVINFYLLLITRRFISSESQDNIVYNIPGAIFVNFSAFTICYIFS